MQYGAVVLGVGGAVHVVLDPHLEAIRVNAVLAIVSGGFALEVVAGGQLKHRVGLLAHQ